MSTAVLSALPGLGFPWTREPEFKSRKPQSVSGKITSIADWSIPLYKWTLTYEFLRQGVVAGLSYAEEVSLRGFFEQRLGGFDSFLYSDPDDNTVASQGIGTGDGTTTQFQMVRAQGGFSIPVLAPNLSQSSTIYLNGSPQSNTTYSITQWGATNPGVLTFDSAPGGAVAITADFSYYFPCSFDDDSLTFSKFMSNLYSLKKMSFTSIK